MTTKLEGISGRTTNVTTFFAASLILTTFYLPGFPFFLSVCLIVCLFDYLIVFYLIGFLSFCLIVYLSDCLYV